MHVTNINTWAHNASRLLGAYRARQGPYRGGRFRIQAHMRHPYAPEWKPCCMCVCTRALRSARAEAYMHLGLHIKVLTTLIPGERDAANRSSRFLLKQPCPGISNQQYGTHVCESTPPPSKPKSTGSPAHGPCNRNRKSSDRNGRGVKMWNIPV